jgi:Ca2+-binding RTX toxin-like protein
VYGGDGDDVFLSSVGDGNDRYYGDAGSDTLDLASITAAITARLGATGSTSSSQTGSDKLYSVENIVTGSGNDSITAGAGANVMDGGAGNDTFRFLSAADANGDTILGFQPGDRLDLSAIDANAGVRGNQAFQLVSGSSFNGPSKLIVTHEERDDGDYTVVAGNTSGAARAPTP